MAPKIITPMNKDDTDAETEALIAQLLALDIAELNTTLSGSSIDTVEELNQRLSEQLQKVKEQQTVVKNALKSRSANPKTFTKKLTVLLHYKGNEYEVYITVADDTTVGGIRFKVVEALNSLLKKTGQRPMAKAVARALYINIDSRDYSNNPRKGIKSLGNIDNIPFAMSFPPSFNSYFYIPMSAVIEDEESEEEDNEQ